MDDHDKMQYIRYMQMREELENAVYGGIELKLDGADAKAHEIAAVCVFREDNDYMRNYRRNDEGYVAELDFDNIKKKKK